MLCCAVQMLLRAWACDYSSHNKVLLFSHSTRCLDLLEVRFRAQNSDRANVASSHTDSSQPLQPVLNPAGCLGPLALKQQSGFSKLPVFTSP